MDKSTSSDQKSQNTIYTGPYFADTQIIENGTTVVLDSKANTITNTNANTNKNNNRNDQNTNCNINLLNLGSQMSQSSVLNKVKMLSENEENLVLDSSCERETQELMPLKLDMESIDLINGVRSTRASDNIDPLKQADGSSSSSSQPFKSLNLDNSLQAETPWMNKIKNPFDETPQSNGKDDHTINNSPFNLFNETPTLSKTKDKSVFNNLINTPSVPKRKDVFQKIRENEEKRQELEIEPSLPIGNIDFGSFGPSTYDKKAYDENAEDEDDFIIQPREKNSISFRNETPMKLNWNLNLDFEHLGGANKDSQLSSSTSSKLPNLMNDVDDTQKISQIDTLKITQTLEETNLNSPLSGTTRTSGAISEPANEVTREVSEINEEVATTIDEGLNEDSTHTDEVSEIQEEEPTMIDDQTQDQETEDVNGNSHSFDQPPSLIPDSHPTSSGQELFTFADTQKIDTQANSTPQQTVNTQGPTQVIERQLPIISSGTTEDNIPATASQPENYKADEQFLDQSQLVQVPGTNPDHYTESEVLTSPIRRKSFKEIVSEDENEGKDEDYEVPAEDSLQKHHRVLKIKDSDDEKSSQTKNENQKHNETIVDDPEMVDEDDERFEEKVKRLNSTNVRLSSLKSQTGRRTSDSKTLEEQIGFDLTQEISEVEDATAEQQSEDEDEDEDKDGDEENDDDAEYQSGDVNHDSNVHTERSSVELGGATQGNTHTNEDATMNAETTPGLKFTATADDEMDVDREEPGDEDEYDDGDLDLTQYEKDDDFKVQEEEESKIDNTIAEETIDGLTNALKRTKRKKKKINYQESSDEEEEKGKEKEDKSVQRPTETRIPIPNKQRDFILDQEAPGLIKQTSSPLPKKRKLDLVALPKEVLHEEPKLSLTHEDVLLPNAVWCLFDVNYFPGTLLKKLLNHRYQVRFETSIDLMTSITPLDLRINDVVTYFNDEYVVNGLCVENDDITDKNVIRCMRGYDTVIVRRNKKKKAIRSKKPVTEEELKLPISLIRMSNEQWYKVNRVVLQSELKRGNTVLAEDVLPCFAKNHIASDGDTTVELQDDSQQLMEDDLFQISSTPIINKSNIIESELLKLSLENAKIPPAAIFKDCLFFVTGSEKLKTDLKKSITANGGILIDRNLTDIFLNYILKNPQRQGKQESIFQFHQAEELHQVPDFIFKFLSEFKMSALITDKHYRTSKYVEFLALGWPILSESIIHDSIKAGQFLSNRLNKYLLPSGSSKKFNNNVKSLDIFKFLVNLQADTKLHSQFANNHIIGGGGESIDYHVFVVGGNNDKNIKISKFIIWLITKNKRNIKLFNTKKDMLRSLKDIRFEGKSELLIFNAKYEFVNSLMKEMKPKKTIYFNKSTGDALKVRFIDWEWLVQCIITGFIIESDLEMDV